MTNNEDNDRQNRFADINVSVFKVLPDTEAMDEPGPVAFRNGEIAYAAGVTLKQNPEHDLILREQWKDGWNKAHFMDNL
jgi:hypothetical protein